MSKIAKVLGRCARCETLPCQELSLRRLYLWFPLGHSINKFIAYLNSRKFEYKLIENEQCAIVDLNNKKIANTIIELETVLTSKELQDTRVLSIDSEREPQLSDFSRVTNLSEFINLSQSGWLLDMLAAERFSSHFQPIVYAEDTSQIFAQEALLRGIDELGNLINPGLIFQAAHKANLIFQLDRIARLTAIRETVQYGITGRVFINFTPTAIYDPVFCLRSTVSAVEKAGIPCENIVFEITESERAQDSNHLKEILRFYRDSGFLIALDDLGAGYSGLNLIHQLRPDFIKLDMELIRNVDRDPYKAVITEKILAIAQSLNIKTIAEGIETQEELKWVRDRGANFVQGYLIAKPVAPPATVTPRIGN